MNASKRSRPTLCTPLLYKSLVESLGNRAGTRCFSFLLGCGPQPSVPLGWLAAKPPQDKDGQSACSWIPATCRQPWRLPLTGLVSGSNAHLWSQCWEGPGKLLNQRPGGLGLSPEPDELSSTLRAKHSGETNWPWALGRQKSLTQGNQNLWRG